MPSANQKVNALATAWLISSLAYSIVYPFIPIYLHEERGIPMNRVGLLFPVMGAAMILMPPLAGRLADMIGGRIMPLGQALRGIVFVILAIMAFHHAPFWLFLIVLGLNSAIGALFQVGADTYLASHTDLTYRARAYSKIRIGTNIGWSIGPMLGAFLARTPFFIMFATTAVLCFAGSSFIAIKCKDQASEDNHSPIVRQARVKRGNLLLQANLLSIIIPAFLIMLLISQLYSTLAVYASSVVGISRNALGLVYSLNGFIVITCQLPVTNVLDRIKLQYRRRLVIGVLIYISGYFSLGFATNAWMIAASVIVITLGETVVWPSLYSAISQLATKGEMGRYVSTISLVRGIGLAIGPYLGSLLFQRFSETPTLLWGILTLPAWLALGQFALAGRRRGEG